MVIKTENNEERLVGYLLRELPETEWEALEAEFFADPTLLARLEAVEHDLIEGYVSGKLEAAQHAKFEKVYLDSRQRREKVEFYRALASTLPLVSSIPLQLREAEKVSWWQSFVVGRTFPGFAVATLLVLLFGGIWLAREYQQLRQKTAEVETQRALLAQRETELRVQIAQIATMESRNSELAKELENARRQLAAIVPPQSGTAVVPAFVWTLFGLRSANPPLERPLPIPTGTKSARLSFKMTNASFRQYRLELRSENEQLIGSYSGLKAKRNVVTLSVPISQLEQTRSLVLSGSQKGTSSSPPRWDDLGVFPIAIVRP